MQDIIAKLTAKNDEYACAITDKIISESKDTDEWYEYYYVCMRQIYRNIKIVCVH